MPLVGDHKAPPELDVEMTPQVFLNGRQWREEKKRRRLGSSQDSTLWRRCFVPVLSLAAMLSLCLNHRLSETCSARSASCDSISSLSGHSDTAELLRA